MLRAGIEGCFGAPEQLLHRGKRQLHGPAQALVQPAQEQRGKHVARALEVGALDGRHTHVERALVGVHGRAEKIALPCDRRNDHACSPLAEPVQRSHDGRFAVQRPAHEQLRLEAVRGRDVCAREHLPVQRDRGPVRVHLACVAHDRVHEPEQPRIARPAPLRNLGNRRDGLGGRIPRQHGVVREPVLLQPGVDREQRVAARPMAAEARVARGVRELDSRQAVDLVAQQLQGEAGGAVPDMPVHDVALDGEDPHGEARRGEAVSCATMLSPPILSCRCLNR